MSKLPWMKFYPADWSQDTTPLSLAGRGAWITIVCAMWRSGSRGELSMPLAGFCRLLGTPEAETLAVIDELTVTGICNAVTGRDKNITLACRRMIREEKHRNGNALRQYKYRTTHQGNAPVTGEISDIRSQKSDKEKIAVKDKPSPPAPRIKIADQQWIEELRPDCKKQGIDLDAEIIKAKRWLLKAPGRKFTQKYFINWLNRCDKTLDIKPSRKSYAADKTVIRNRAIAEIMERLKTERLATPEESFMEIAARLALSDKYKDIPGAVDKAVWTLNYERKV